MQFLRTELLPRRAGQLLRIPHGLFPGKAACLPSLAKTGLGGLLLLGSGCASTPPPTPISPHLVLGATAFAFANQSAGSASATQTETLRNTGDGALQITSLNITGAGSVAFTVTDGCTAPLNPGATCTVTISFTPPAVGSFAATLAITGSADTAATVPLTGTGVAPQAQFSATQLTFPAMDAGYASDPSPLGIANTGTAPLDLSTMTLSGPGAAAFKLSNPCPQNLAVGENCSLSVTFTPSAATAYSALLSLPGNAAIPAQSVALSGMGTPDTPLSAWRYAFAHCKTEPVNILVLGDSRSIVDLTIHPGLTASLADTFGQKWADRLAATLQSTCGSHGSGLVPLLPLAQQSFLNGDFYQMQGNWTTAFGLGPQQFGGVPANMVLRATSTAVIQFNAPGPFDRLTVYCESGPGLNPWTLSVDASPVGTCGGPAAIPQAVLATSPAVPFATHTAALTCSQAPCAAYGMEAVASTSGVSVHNVSIGSCAAECFGLDPASQLAFTDLIPAHHLVIVELITNDPGVGYSPDTFGASLGNIIDHERARPGSPSILIYAPLQDDLPGQDPYYPVLSSVANTYATAYFDLRTTYGTAFLPQYFGPDGAHENNQGHALTLEQILPILVPGN